LDVSPILFPLKDKRVAQVGQTFNHDAYKCLVLCRMFLLNRVCWLGCYCLTFILTKLFYFTAVLGDVIFNFNKEKFVFSLHYNFIWRTVYTIYFRDMDNLSLNMNCTLGFYQTVNFFISLSIYLRTKAMYFQNVV